MYRNAPLLHYVPATVFALLSGYSLHFCSHRNDFRLLPKFDRIFALNDSHEQSLHKNGRDAARPARPPKRAVVRMFDLFVKSKNLLLEIISNRSGRYSIQFHPRQIRVRCHRAFATRNELRQHGITLTLLESEREQIPDVPAVYFVQPTAKNIQKISQDLGKKLYESYHLRIHLESVAEASRGARDGLGQSRDFLSSEKSVRSKLRFREFRERRVFYHASRRV